MLLNAWRRQRLRLLKVRCPRWNQAAALARLHSRRIDRKPMSQILQPAPGKVLVIEDDAGTADEIQAELASHGFQIDRVVNGGDGLAHALRHTYDVITLDRMLP